MFKFNPKSEQQIFEDRQAKISVLEKGWYACELAELQGGQSKTSGKPQFVVKMSVQNPTGINKILRDYIPLESAGMEFKLRHFFDMCGLIEIYEEGQCEISDFKIGSKGFCYVGIQEASQALDGRMYDRKNIIQDYARTMPNDGVKEGTGAKPVPVEEAPFKDDDISF